MLVYMSGHLSFFRRSQTVVEKFMQFPNLRNLDAYLNMPWIYSDSGERLCANMFAHA